MSWSLSTSNPLPVFPIPELRDSLQALQDALPDEYKTPEAVEQMNFAIETAVSIVKEKLIHNEQTAKVYINLSGHANPNHDDAPGMANDAMYLSIYRATS